MVQERWMLKTSKLQCTRNWIVTTQSGIVFWNRNWLRGPFTQFFNDVIGLHFASLRTQLTTNRAWRMAIEIKTQVWGDRSILTLRWLSALRHQYITSSWQLWCSSNFIATSGTCKFPKYPHCDGKLTVKQCVQIESLKSNQLDDVEIFVCV